MFSNYYMPLGASLLYFFIDVFDVIVFDVFDVNLIANKRGAPGAPPIHYPINCSSKK